jgi:hypothetical protein
MSEPFGAPLEDRGKQDKLKLRPPIDIPGEVKTRTLAQNRKDGQPRRMRPSAWDALKTRPYNGRGWRGELAATIASFR